MRGAFQESKSALLELMEKVESDSESENEMNESDSDSERDEDMSDDLNNLMMALGTIKF
jgi:U3 small nucleolar RNA-associated protein 14